MRITANNGAMLGTAYFARRFVYQKADQSAPAGRNLTVRPSAASLPGIDTRERPLAAFLAQLIAKVQDMPVSRERRRADPAESANAYRAAAELGRTSNKKSLRVV
jgi:hypothetical protein